MARRPGRDGTPGTMSEPLLQSDLWIAAHVRRCDLEFIPVAIRRKGDPNAGAVLIKVNRFDAGCTVYSQVRTEAGAAGWMRGSGPAPVPEPDADAYVARQVRFDSDLWVIEIEDRHGRYALPGKLIS